MTRDAPHVDDCPGRGADPPGHVVPCGARAAVTAGESADTAATRSRVRDRKPYRPRVRRPRPGNAPADRLRRRGPTARTPRTIAGRKTRSCETVFESFFPKPSSSSCPSAIWSRIACVAGTPPCRNVRDRKRLRGRPPTRRRSGSGGWFGLTASHCPAARNAGGETVLAESVGFPHAALQGERDVRGPRLFFLSFGSVDCLRPRSGRSALARDVPGNRSWPLGGASDTCSRSGTGTRRRLREEAVSPRAPAGGRRPRNPSFRNPDADASRSGSRLRGSRPRAASRGPPERA